ncbi:uncharacterized protein LOC143273316 isoform X3 [Peromyscus maniculatus bairdii]|uniref:uncharacterized protein LOC143273316 isoform X3 n=1 Tax=Peromyscus maniculatus bairdii TaxID=230844 RepID=UPI003FD0ABAF
MKPAMLAWKASRQLNSRRFPEWGAPEEPCKLCTPIACPWLSARCQQNTFKDSQQRRNRSRPLLGTEQCHGGDNGLCLAGCENIRCAGSTAAESSLNEKRYRRQPLGTLCLPHWCRGAGKARSKTSNC